MVFIILLFLISVIGILSLINLNLPFFIKFFGSVGILYLDSILISKKYNLKQEFGILLLKTKACLSYIKKLSYYSDFWRVFSDLGFILGFGLFSFFINQDKIDYKARLYFVGLLLGFYLLLISSHSSIVLSTILNKNPPPFNLSILPFFLFILGGFSLCVFFSLLANSIHIIMLYWDKFIVGSQGIIRPGISLIIPGINLPFFEGILSLILILLVHELAHAILAVANRIPIKSMGIALFGFLPIGAFVEPNENVLLRSKKEVQNRVYIAGITSNFLFSCFFFSILIVFLYLFPQKQVSYFVFDFNNIFLKFIFTLLSLLFSLNFILAMVNLLPLPFFDGGRIYENLLGKKYYEFLSYFTLFLFLINILPWFL